MRCGLDQRDDLEAERQVLRFQDLSVAQCFREREAFFLDHTKLPEGRRFIFVALRLCEFARSTSTPSLSTCAFATLCASLALRREVHCAHAMEGAQQQQYIMETVPAAPALRHGVHCT